MEIRLKQADITGMHVDAIVNAANIRLAGGGGVDGAIHRAGGPDIMRACDEIRAKQGGCPTGEAVLTTAGRLPAKYVIHTVGPIWSGSGEEAELLAACYKNSMLLAQQHKLASIAFPNISTGVYGFPKAQAASIAIDTVRAFSEEPGTIKEVYFICFDEENYQLYRSLLAN